MCGICGYAGISDARLIEDMVESLAHRGPDDRGVFVDGGFALGHRRLSVIDLGGGHQPMTSPDGALTITYNGEIYNFRELRSELEARGTAFQTESDTEVLLHLYRYEREGALERLNGMFAFAIYDRERRELFAARDRMGIKPLHYLLLPNRLVFASEAKAILRYRDWSRTLNAPGVLDYLSLRYVPGDRGLFREVRRLPPGHWLRWREGEIELQRYWRPPEGVAGTDRSEEEWLEEFGELLERSVNRRLISDVAFGAYLSGGIDSSLIVALMSRLVSKPVKTFSVGFGYRHDELDQAEATAKQLGCDHHVVECRAHDVNLLPEVVYYADEPLGDPINIPMFQLARAAKRDVTVILTGEGADEIFGGYLFHKIIWAAQVYRRLVPRSLRRGLIAPAAGLVPVTALNWAFQYPADLGARGKLKAIDYLETLESNSVDEHYRHLISLFDARELKGLFTPDFESLLCEQSGAEREEFVPSESHFDDMLRLQFDHWLPDNMLLRQDRMSMASAVEGRVPYLDHELVEFAFRLPRKLRLRRLVGKYLLRRLGDRLLPRETSRRRKMPFYVPIELFFRDSQFRELAEDLLSESSLRRRGIFQPEAIAQLRGAMDPRNFLLVKQIFSLLTLELWFRIFWDQNGIR